MSTDTSQPDLREELEPQADGGSPGGPGRTKRRPRRRRNLRVTAGVTAGVIAAAGGVAVALGDPFGDDNAAPQVTSAGTSTAAVRQGSLSTQVNQSGTLAYAARSDGSPYGVINQARGVYTWVPSAGKEIRCGDVLYRVGETPVALLCGTTPAHRDLAQGDEGADVRQLNENLVKLGYAEESEVDDDYFGWGTADALEELQDELGADETGTLKLGDAVFLPGPLRVSKATAKTGTNARPGTPVAEATSTKREVTVDLEASQQAQVKVGDRVQITLPDNRTTSGKVSRIGTVATSSSDKKEDAANATIPVYITLKKPKAAGKLDQAPVRVEITTDGVKDALIVPVTALVGQAGGGHAVERVDSQGARELVPVTIGMFDNSAGLVQVTGNLKAGDTVVVPAT